MTTFDEIVDAVSSLIDAKSAYDEALKEYEGYSWDWAGRDLIETLEKAKERLRGLLKEYISQEVKEAIKSLSPVDPPLNSRD
jgi:hypothetical protein